MRVRDLGALVVAVDADEQSVVGRRGAAMLALLTIHANRRVSLDALMEAAWGDDVTDGSASTLESHIWRLRQLLEPSRTRRQPPTVLVSDAGGYRLIAGASSVDSLFFAECAGEVRDLLAGGHADAARRRADTALALWRGRPYGSFAEEEWAGPAVARLDELHGNVQERRIEALVATGALDVALSDLQPLIAQMPFREQLRVPQMEALYRSGRGEQALQAYADARQTLIDEVGIEPGLDLQQLHRRVLNNDPTLIPTDRPRAPSPRSAEVEVHLPPALTPLVGRDETVAQLTATVSEHRLVTITGAAGSGKTRVAVEVARAAAEKFLDGVWFVDLTAVSDPALVVDVIVSTIGFAASAGATPAEDLRTYLRTRRVLLVLDNCEHVLPGVVQIVQLTLGDPGIASDCCFLATSREPLDVDGEIIWTLPPLGLPGGELDLYPSAAPAVELFLQRLRAAAPTLRVDESVLARAIEICRSVDGLPLPLELAAARARSYTLDDIAAQVEADPGRLGRIGRGPDDHRRTVRAAIEWSHRLLRPDEQLAHRRMSVLPGPFTSELAATVIGDAGSADVDDLLAQLVHRSLLSSDGAREPGRPTAFRQLATVRSHARHALAAAGETVVCSDRRDAWVAGLLAARPPLGSVAEAQWYRVIDDNYPTVRAVLARHLIDEPSAFGGRLAPPLIFYWYYREGLVEGARWLRLAHGALLGGEPVDSLLAQISLASALATQGRIDLARPHIDEVLERVDLVPDPRLIEVGEGLVGLVTAAWVPDAYELVVALHGKLARIVERTGSSELSLLADAVGCIAAFAAGRIADAVSQARDVQERAVVVDNLMATWVSAGSPMIAALLNAQPAEGIGWVDRLMRAHLRLGSGAGGSFIETRANFAAQAGDYLEAARLYGAAYSETRRAAMVWPRRPLTEQLLTVTRSYLSRGDFERAWQDGERLSMKDLVEFSSSAA